MLLSLLIAFALQIIFFCYKINNSPIDGYESLFDTSYSAIFYMFVLFIAVAFLNITTMSSKTLYTVMRLRISEKELFVCQSIYNLLGYLMVWFMQSLTIVIGFYIYKQSLADAEIVKHSFINHQTFFLACYRSNFIHFMFPLDDILALGKNLVLYLSLAISSSGMVFFARRKKFAIEFYVVLLATFVSVSSDWVGVSTDLSVIAFSVLFTALIVFRVLSTKITVTENKKCEQSTLKEGAI